jgi:hypothetical protein
MNQKRAKKIRQVFPDTKRSASISNYKELKCGTIMRTDKCRQEFQRINNLLKNKPIGETL